MVLAGKTVLVTGASGFLGGTLACRLAAEGAHVRALARTPEKASYIRNQNNLEIVQGNINDIERIREVTQGCNYVFHTAVNYLDWEQQHRVNVDGTRNMIEAAADADVERFVHCSSIAVYGYTRAGKIAESDTLLSSTGDPYNVTKVKAEDVVRETATRRNLSYAIIRPGMIYGPRSGQWTDFVYNYVQRGLVVWIGKGDGSIFPIHVDDVADMMAVLAIHPAAHNEAFNCVSTEQVTWHQYLMEYARLAGHQRYVGIPTTILSATARILAVAGRGRIRAAPEYLTALLRHAHMDMTKAHEKLGWQPRYNLKNGVESCEIYLREKGHLI